jgi:hypothetical protein
MLEETLSRLLSEQSASGAFPSTVGDGDQAQVDESCFVTAQVAIILTDLHARGLGDCAALVHARDGALDFVEACAARDIPGTFRFYPEDWNTPKLPIRLPPDGDDTALAWMALMAGGRRSKRAAQAVLPALFERLRTRAARRGDPPWVRSGVYRTWFDAGGGRNPADVCVNVNVLACLARSGCAPAAEDAGACDAVNAACRTADLSRSSLRSLAPFYADVTEVEIALERAVAAGATPLWPAWLALKGRGFVSQDKQSARPPDRPLYCNDHGRPLWRSASLQRARRCHDLSVALLQAQRSLPSATGGGDARYV